jgi:hypothetical protein
LRAGPLSNPKVIEILNKYYVPVYLSNEDYQGKTPVVPKDEFLAWQKIYHEALKEKRDAGSVCVYLVAPDGKGLASLIVSQAAHKDNLLKLLQTIAEKQHVKPGDAVVPIVCQATPPVVEPMALVLHLVARANHKGSWGEFPSENWIILKEAEWKTWLPPAPKTGSTYTIPDKEAGKVLTYFFPQTEVCNFEKLVDPDGPYEHRIDTINLHGKVLSATNGVVKVRLDGTIKVKHKFYPGHKDNNYAESTVVGYLDVDQKSGRLTRLALATTAGQYGQFGFSAAVVSEK